MKIPFRASVGGGSRWSNASMAAALAAGLALTFATAAQAGSPDAQVTQTQAFSVLTMPQMAQTFTALHTGQLYQVDLYAADNYYLAPTTVEIWDVSAGVPNSIYRFADGTVAATSLASPLGVSVRWRQFPLSKPVPVVAGTQYAVVTHTNLNYYFRWGYTNSSNANFTGGKMFVRFYSGTFWSQVQTNSSAFDFISYVQSAGSQPKPPVIAADNPLGASTKEGAAPTMTGTYADPNGGTVSLKADYGQVTPQSGAGGTWSWTGPAADEGTPPSSVTISATNSAGLSTPVTFPLTVQGVDPTATITTDPASLPEGTSLGLIGTATSPDPADQAAGFKFAWNVTRDGSPYQTATGSTYNFSVADEGTYIVYMRATDDGGMPGDATPMTVVGTEVTPTVRITSITPSDPLLASPLIIAPSETLNFAGAFTDPAQESHTYRWDFGDGASSTLLNAPHAYTAAGTYTARLTVKDDEGTAGTATVTVTVQTPQQSLDAMIAYVKSLSTLNGGQQNSLIAKLNAASDSISRGNNKAASNQMNAFLNELDADLTTGKISSTAYNALRADVHAVGGAIGTYNRFVEWWPLFA
jgi:PKD repeat protein